MQTLEPRCGHSMAGEEAAGRAGGGWGLGGWGRARGGRLLAALQQRRPAHNSHLRAKLAIRAPGFAGSRPPVRAQRLPQLAAAARRAFRRAGLPSAAPPRRAFRAAAVASRPRARRRGAAPRLASGRPPVAVARGGGGPPRRAPPPPGACCGCRAGLAPGGALGSPRSPLEGRGMRERPRSCKAGVQPLGSLRGRAGSKGLPGGGPRRAVTVWWRSSVPPHLLVRNLRQLSAAGVHTVKAVPGPTLSPDGYLGHESQTRAQAGAAGSACHGHVPPHGGPRGFPCAPLTKTVRLCVRGKAGAVFEPSVPYHAQPMACPSFPSSVFSSSLVQLHPRDSGQWSSSRVPADF